MNVLFLQSLTYPFIGIMSLSAVLRKNGHDPRLLFLDFNRPTSAGKLCQIGIPRIYDPVFLLSFYRYVRLAYNKGRLEALGKVLKNALEAVRA